MNYLLISILLIFIAIQTGCSSKSMRDPQAEAKFDAALRMKLKETIQANAYTPLQCLVKLNGPFDDGKMKMLKESGVKVITVLKEIVTIEGQAEAIRKVASYDFVHSISLSQTSYPKEKQ